MTRTRLSAYLAVLFAVSDSITALTFPSHELVRKDATCGDPNATQCPGVPNGFCCSSSAQCLVLASNTTVLCCPKGETCELIAPITCDINQQNVKLHPLAALFTTNLAGT